MKNRFLIFPICLVWLAGCVNLKPVPSQTESFALGPVEMQAPDQSRQLENPIYIVRPQVPTYLDGSRLSYRSSSGEVINMPGARWAEPLAEGIARAVSLYLSGSVHGVVEGYYPWPNTSQNASRLSLNFQRFGATESGEVQVVAQWTLKPDQGEVISGQFVSDSISWQVGDPATLVAAYNEALRTIAMDVEKSLGIR